MVICNYCALICYAELGEMEEPLWEEVAGWLWGVGRNCVPQRDTLCSLCKRSSEAGKGQLQDLAPSWGQRGGWVRALCMSWVQRAPLNGLDVTVPIAELCLHGCCGRGQTLRGMGAVCGCVLYSMVV